MMTPLEWFAFVILPASLAVVAIGASRLFDRFHPISAEAVGAYPIGAWKEQGAAYEHATRAREAVQHLHAAIEAEMQTLSEEGRRVAAVREEPEQSVPARSRR